MKRAVYILLLSLSLYACQESSTVLGEHTFPPNGWSSTDIIEMPNLQAAADQDVYIRIEHQQDYGFENLYVRLHTDTAKQVVSIPLMSNQGFWIGEKNGDTYIVDYPLKEALFQSLSIEQYARMPILPGLIRLQVIAKSKEK